MSLNCFRRSSNLSIGTILGPSDGPNMVPLNKLDNLLKQLNDIDNLIKK